MPFLFKAEFYEPGMAEDGELWSATDLGESGEVLLLPPNFGKWILRVQTVACAWDDSRGFRPAGDEWVSIKGKW